MSADVASSGRRMSAWEIREKMKKTRRKSDSGAISAATATAIHQPRTYRGRRLDRASSDGNVAEVDPDLPPAFRTFTLSKPKDQQIKRAGRRVVTRRSDGMTTIGLQKETLEERRLRRSSVLDSFAKQGLDGSDSSLKFQSPSQPKTTKKTITDHGGFESDADSSEDDDDKSLDLGAIEKIVHKVSKMHDSRSRRSFSSDRGQGSGDLNRSLDLSSHNGPRNKSGDIVTVASDEEWARFKLLGRTGLGDIIPSDAAKKLIRQNSKVLLDTIKKVVALRDEADDLTESMHHNSIDFRTGNLLEEVRSTVGVKKVRSRYKRDPESIELNDKVEAEVEDFVTVISHLYRDNPFHNFEHASTVLNSVNKVVSLADAPDDIDYTDIRFITTDPWTHFALVFSALIHDVDHAGVPNAQLIKEGAHVAHAYKNKSVAEQNSLEISWSLLMEPCYRNLRETLFVNSEELMHFRSLVVTATLATDIADKELAAMRKDRAADALAVMDEEGPTSDDIASRKATFVLETLIQVADVSHLMMPFPMYKKWNYRLLRETHKAFLAGRAETDPIENWYKGEFGFFDFYIIPLAKKLDKCGIDSSSYVENATNNRKMWEEVGEELVSGFKKELNLAKGSVRSLLSESDLAKDDSSSEESSFNSSGFVSFSDLESDSDDDEKANTSAVLRTPEKTHIASSFVKGRIKAIQKSKAEEYNGKLRKILKGNHLFSPTKQTKNGISPSKKADDKSLKVAGNPIRRIPSNRRKASSSYSVESNANDKKKITGDNRIGRMKTTIPPGELRYKQRSKSASSEPKVAEVSSDNENKKSGKPNKKKKNTRSRSLDNSIHKNAMKGKRPGKVKAKSSVD